MKKIVLATYRTVVAGRATIRELQKLGIIGENIQFAIEAPMGPTSRSLVTALVEHFDTLKIQNAMRMQHPIQLIERDHQWIGSGGADGELAFTSFTVVDWI